jgi:hypothetical protein
MKLSLRRQRATDRASAARLTTRRDGGLPAGGAVPAGDHERQKP